MYRRRQTIDGRNSDIISTCFSA